MCFSTITEITMTFKSTILILITSFLILASINNAFAEDFHCPIPSQMVRATTYTQDSMAYYEAVDKGLVFISSIPLSTHFDLNQLQFHQAKIITTVALSYSLHLVCNYLMPSGQVVEFSSSNLINTECTFLNEPIFGYEQCTHNDINQCPISCQNEGP